MPESRQPSEGPVATAAADWGRGVVAALPIPPLTLSQERHGAQVVIALAGELDLATTHLLTGALERAAGERVVIDLSAVGFMDLTALRAIAAEIRARPDGAEGLRIVYSRAARRLFELVPIAPFPLYATREAALVAPAGAGRRP